MLALVEDNNTQSIESQWIPLAQQGDKAAFKQLYQQHHPRIYALVLRLCGCRSFAEEITQECFVRVWQKLPSFRGESQFSTWLHRLCINQALSMIKAQKSLWARFLNQESVSQESMLEASVNDDYSELDCLILKLPERARQVFVLHAVEGYRHEEVANLLGMATGTSKAQFHRARKLLKEML
ncbi:MAG: RNA polymerase sigma factor [Parashewanella sp.]